MRLAGAWLLTEWKPSPIDNISIAGSERILWYGQQIAIVESIVKL